MKKILLAIIIVLILGAGAYFLFIKNPKVVSPSNPQAQGKPTSQNPSYLLPVTEINYLPLRNWNIADLILDARSAISYDSKADKILFKKNSDKKLPIASLTKLMTAVVIVENIDLGETVRISGAAIEKSVLAEGGKVLLANEIFKAGDLLKIMLIISSNDAAFAFQEHFKGRGLDLVKLMNDKAAELGMADSKFTDPAGLDDNGYSTAEDFLKITKYSLKYPLIHEILKTQQVMVFGELPSRTSGDYSAGARIPHSLNSTNKLLSELSEVVSGKTGFTDGALESMLLVTKSPENGYVISIILGSYDKFLYTKNLVKWVEQAYIWK